MEKFKIGDKVIIKSKDSGYIPREGIIYAIFPSNPKNPLNWTVGVKCKTDKKFTDPSLLFIHSEDPYIYDHIWGYENDLTKI